jgi:Mg2+-importing ATPase
LTEAARLEPAEALKLMESSPEGLASEAACERLEQFGPNEIAQERRHNWVQRLYGAARNPLVVLLTVLAILSFATGDFRAGTVMLLMVILGLSLRFIQESRADTAAARLKAMISVTATVVRDGQPREIPLRELVPGDIVRLSAGDMIRDLRIIALRICSSFSRR